MKRIAKSLVLCLGMLVLFPGCSRYVCWFEDVFNRGKRQKTYDCLTERYIRSVRVYDQFDTLGIFDALWLHDEVREAYVSAYASTRCLDDMTIQRMLHNEFEQNRYTISFYVLATTRHDLLLTDDSSEWHVQLIVDGECVSPIDIKFVSLSPEYIRFFGPWFNKFKQHYIITFDAAAPDGTRLIGPITEKISLAFKRLGQWEYMTWCLDGYGRALPVQTFNRNILAYDLDNNF
jgi:hypothetical protein